MNKKRQVVLITGAAGFIGSHTVDLLVKHGYDVIGLDNLDPQVHGDDIGTPINLISQKSSRYFRFVYGNICDRVIMKNLVTKVDAIIHLSAISGMAQSMYKPHYFADVNIRGTAMLMDVLANNKNKVNKVVIASSVSIYGEGSYRCDKCGVVHPTTRSTTQLKRIQWEHECPTCFRLLTPIGTPESAPTQCSSVYAITKKAQEELMINFGKTFKLPIIALRYFNVFGARQSLNNPYTGAIAIFVSRLKNKKSPVVFEDGRQSRDFIHVSDVARANLIALEAPFKDQRSYNVGTGYPTTILEIANMISSRFSPGIHPTVAKQYRVGDIRHCYADISRAVNELGFRSSVSIEEGFNDLLEWSSNQGSKDRFEHSILEMKEKGLLC